VGALVGAKLSELTLSLLKRSEIAFPPDVLSELAGSEGGDPLMRGALLARRELPSAARLVLVQRVTESLRECRIVRGSLMPDRLDRVLRDNTDLAVSSIGEAAPDSSAFVEQLVGSDQLNTRLLLHSVITGHVLFFSACLASLAGVSADKVFALLESGSRQALNALFARCGLDADTARLFSRLIHHARTADLSDDLAARHYVVTALTEEMLADHEGHIPLNLEEAFGYLSAQNVALARQAARGVMRAFADSRDGVLPLPAEPALQLPAA
jgi:uncharacterized protein (DUF2336 family)